MKLNENQNQAVEYNDGPLRIVAGPGSGKTRTIVQKIIYLLENNLAKPWEILAITFTNKAANEIKERVFANMNSKFSNIFTYHGWCHYFLRTEAENIGINKDFVIMDISDRDKIIDDIIKINNFDIEKKYVIKKIDEIGRENLSIEKYLSMNDDKDSFKIIKIYEKFKNLKLESGLYDFNDLIIEVKNILTSNSKLANKWKDKYKYIFIDEFQDTNNIQFEIIKAITDENSNLIVVGDPDQNIYSWRGANISLINNFNKYFKNAKTIMLNINYRSTPEIINSSNNLIKNNKNRVSDFFSKPSKEHGKPVNIMRLYNDGYEAYEIAKKINSLIKNGYKYHEIAVIIRLTYKTRMIEQSFNENGIPYKVIGAKKFFDRKEVKQTLKFLLFSVKQDNQTFLAIINDPPKKFGPKKIMKATIESEIEKITIWQWLNKYKDNQSDQIIEWIDYTNKLINAIKSGDNVSATLEQYLTDIDYINKFFQEPSREDNIKETLKIIDERINKKNAKKIPISEIIIKFVNDSILSSASDEVTNDGEVSLITAHSSKGTEFPIVFIYSMVEGHWPSQKAIEDGEIEEERRVAYVAMTRAMDRLFITTSNGLDYRGKEIEQSRFINEIFSGNSYNYSDDNYFQSKKSIRENKLNLEIIGKKINHIVYGIGKIKFYDGEFITVKFNNGKILEIIYGHNSYQLIE